MPVVKRFGIGVGCVEGPAGEKGRGVKSPPGRKTRKSDEPALPKPIKGSGWVGEKMIKS